MKSSDQQGYKPHELLSATAVRRGNLVDMAVFAGVRLQECKSGLVDNVNLAKARIFSLQHNVHEDVKDKTMQQRRVVWEIKKKQEGRG